MKLPNFLKEIIMTNLAIDLSNFNVAKLSSSALIVNVSISVWTGRKLDKRVSEEVDQQNSTKTRAGNYHKNLLAGSGKLLDITKVANAIRSWMYTVTQPWGDNGDRVLNMSHFAEFKDRLADYETQFATSVNSFLNDYDTLVAAAAFQLGDLFNREDYPTRETIESKFGFRYSMIPLPQAGDFRVDIGEEGLKQLQDQYEAVLQQRVTGAMTEAWERLHDCLSRMSERLADSEDGKRKIFRDSLVENAIEICGLLKSFNITNDTRMDEMRKQLEDAMRGVDADSLRDSDSLREQTKRKVDNILSKFDL
jgi:hypothetical protein